MIALSRHVLAVGAFAMSVVSCTAQPAFWDELDAPWPLCGAGSQTDLDVHWSNDGRVLTLDSEPASPELHFRGASMTDEYYSGDGYRLEIQLGGVITLIRPDGTVLREC